MDAAGTVVNARVCLRVPALARAARDPAKVCAARVHCVWGAMFGSVVPVVTGKQVAWAPHQCSWSTRFSGRGPQATSTTTSKKLQARAAPRRRRRTIDDRCHLPPDSLHAATDNEIIRLGKYIWSTTVFLGRRRENNPIH
jgi:hypothetical protein